MVAGEWTSPLVVCDAGPLIHLDELECLDLLTGFPAVLVPDVVWEEVERHRPGALSVPAVNLTRVQPPPDLSPQLAALSRSLSLHAGEIAALAVAASQEGALLLTDDTAARLAADSLGLEAHGSLGIIIRAIRTGQRSREQVVGILRSIPSRSTLHLKRQLLEEVLRQVEAQ